MAVYTVLFTPSTAEQLRDLLMKHIDSNDRLLIVQNAFWASFNLMAKIT